MRLLFTTVVINCLLTFNAYAQPTWKTLPDNPYLAGTGPFDIAIDDAGGYYMVYAVYNSTSGYYDIQFDRYTMSSGWTQLLTHPTTCTNTNGNLAVKTVRANSGLFALATTDDASEITFFQISAGTAYALLPYSFPGLSPYSKWSIYPGTFDGEVYFMESYSGTSHLFGFNYGTQQWDDLSDPFAGTGVYPGGFFVYADDDSVFVAANYTTGGYDNISLRVAQKGVWVWSNYSGNGKVYYDNGGTADTVQTQAVDPYFLFGKPDGSKCFITIDQGVALTFSVGNGTFGDGMVFPLDYNQHAQFTTSANGAYMMTFADNLADPHVVFERPHVASAWTQFTAETFVGNTANLSIQQIKTHPVTQRVMLGYTDDTPSPSVVELKISNNAPTILSDGGVPTSLCANTNNIVLTGLFIEDLDDDPLSLIDVQSSNPSLIDPADVTGNVAYSSPNIYEAYANAAVGTTATQQSVTLTFTFSDGMDDVQYVHTYDIMPNEQVNFLPDTIRICSGADAINLEDFATIPGGEFSIVENDFNGPYFDPTQFTLGFTDVNYMVHDGECGSSAILVVEVIEAPTAVIDVTESTSCSGNDGSATLTISGGETPYNYVWSTGSFTSLDLFDLEPGPLHVDITDANGCSTVADAIIEVSGASITGTVTDVTCNGLANGSVDITISGLADPLQVLWSNGYSTQDVSNLQPGTHTVYVTDAAGCLVAASFDIAEPEPLVLNLFSNPATCGVNDGSALVEDLYGGVPPYTYIWSIGGTSDQISNVPSGVYALTATDASGCEISEFIGVESTGGPTVMSVEITDAHCTGLDGAIELVIDSVGTGIQLDWSNEQNTPEIYNLSPGNYTLDLYNGAGCHSFTVFHVGSIAPERQQLCVVTVDSLTSTNLLVWEKNEDATIDYFRIYRETATPGQFQLIDTVNADNISLFNDVVASPLVKSWTYRITAVDECFVESVPSTSHKTIHLTAEDLGNGDFKPVWNPYFGVSYTEYHVYRFTSTTGWEEIAIVPASQNYYVDTPPNTDGLDYMVDFELEESCIADVVRAQDFNSSRSNRDKGQFTAGQGTGGPNNSLVEIDGGSVLLYPNPVNGPTFVASVEGMDELQYEIVSLTGQLISSGTLKEGKNTLSVGDTENGLYILYLQQGTIRTTTRFVIQQ